MVGGILVCQYEFSSKESDFSFSDMKLAIAFAFCFHCPLLLSGLPLYIL